MKLPQSIIKLFFFSFLHVVALCQVPGIYSMGSYMPLLKNKNVGLVVNHTSIIDEKHLIDTLVSLDVKITSIFSPEHGFSGKYNAGEYINDSLYNGVIPIISLYGKNKKLNDVDLKNLDVLIFDIQDVGVRFYTYISTLHYVMEGCARNNIKLIVLDRPNPHAHYVDGPIMRQEFKSFVGMHSVPIVYGMTIGEYALMINGERWLLNNLICDLHVVKISSYSRFEIVEYNMSPAPSPNLPNLNSILLYPSLCLFEGTSISIGRGTDFPFQVFGAPFFLVDTSIFNFSFTPSPNLGSKFPKHNGNLCYGLDLRNILIHKDLHSQSLIKETGFIDLKYIIQAYNFTPDIYKVGFFNNFFDKLAGNSELRLQIISGFNESKIRQSWEGEIKLFKLIRKKYLLYD